MTIHARIPKQQETVQRTQATSFYEGLVDRLHSQQALNVPRSQASWSAEEGRLGSWNTGVGAMHPSGIGRQYASGVGRQVFDFDPEEVEKETRS